MGGYPLTINFYGKYGSLKWHKLFKILFSTERFYHIGVRIGDSEIFVMPYKQPRVVKAKSLHKIWKPERVVYLGHVDTRPDNLKNLIPEKFLPIHPAVICACLILEHTLFCPWVPKSCFSLVCIILNKLGIEVPMTSSPTKIRRWLDENNCIFWQSGGR